MDAIADVTQRIADIQTKLSSMRPPAVAFADVLQTTSAGGSGTTSAGQTGALDEETLAAASLRPGWASASSGGGSTPAGGGASTTWAPRTSGPAPSSQPDAAPVRKTGGVTVPDELRA